MNNTTSPIRLCVITGSRADYGLLLLLLKQFQKDKSFELFLVVSGSHLSTNFGNTMDQIVSDGFTIHDKVEILNDGNDAHSVCRAMSKAIDGFSRSFLSLQADLLLVLGDRYEILAAVQAALIHRIPVAHIAGGDVTEGAYDDAIRHAVTKMSHLHFATNQAAATRIRQLGENPENIHVVGSPGIDLIKSIKLLDKAQLERELKLSFADIIFLVGFHPATLEIADTEIQCRSLFSALDCYPQATVIFTCANADDGGTHINGLIQRYVDDKPNANFYYSLGYLKYLSLMQCANVVIGNSSSGLYEAPSLGTATVNIGTRQKGREKAYSVFDCEVEQHSIINAIEKALDFHQTVDNPYGDGHAVQSIMSVLREFNPESLHNLVKKRFYEVDHGSK